MTGIGINKDETLAWTNDALRRLWERCLLLALIGVVVWALVDKARDMRSAAELNAFRYSLGALRIALVLDQLHTAVGHSATTRDTTRNPILLLASPPLGYVGEMSLFDVQSDGLKLGSWFFDRHCSCVGYQLRDDRRFVAPSGGNVMTFSMTSGGVLLARETYVWRGEVIN